MGGVALRIKATARPLCSAGTGDREPGLPTPDCAKSAVRPLGPVLGLRAAPLPARGKISWSDIARQSLRAGQRWGPAHRRRRLSVGGVSCPPAPHGLSGGAYWGGARWGRGGAAGPGGLSAGLSRVVLSLPRGHLGDAPGGGPPQLPRKLAAAHLVGTGMGQPGSTLPPCCKAHPARILTSEGCPAPTTMSLPSSSPTSTWLRSLVTATLRIGTFMGRGGAAGSSLEGGKKVIYTNLQLQGVMNPAHICLFILPSTSQSSFEGWLEENPDK